MFTKKLLRKLQMGIEKKESVKKLPYMVGSDVDAQIQQREGKTVWVPARVMAQPEGNKLTYTVRLENGEDFEAANVRDLSFEVNASATSL